MTTFYNLDGTKDGQVAIPPPLGATGAGTPTGQVFNSSMQGFNITQNGKTAPAFFIFATEDGTISAWNPNVNPNSAVIAVDNSKGGSPGDGAVYKGLAIGTTTDGTFLYAANFRNGSVDVFNSKFQLVKSFTDPTVPIGYAPFNVQVLDGKLFVTFAKQDATRHDDVAGAGHGFVDEFNLNGRKIQRVASHGPLNSPWGLAIAPSSFGEFSNDLLVGNFGDGTINVFSRTDQFLGKLDRPNGKPFHETDLWGLMANGNNILFTAGLANKSHGLFGSLSADFVAEFVDGDPDRRNSPAGARTRAPRRGRGTSLVNEAGLVPSLPGPSDQGSSDHEEVDVKSPKGSRRFPSPGSTRPSPRFCAIGASSTNSSAFGCVAFGRSQSGHRAPGLDPQGKRSGKDEQSRLSLIVMSSSGSTRGSLAMTESARQDALGLPA